MTGKSIKLICMSCGARIVRSLAFAAQSFGMAPRGVYTSALPGSDLLDGSVFIRVSIAGFDTS